MSRVTPARAQASSPDQGTDEGLVCWLGEGVSYESAWALQRRLAERRAEGSGLDTLLLLEHEHLFTTGRRFNPEHVLLDQRRMAEMGVRLVEADRGGEVTYHGPGQLVGYPIVWLGGRGMGPRRYVQALEEVLVEALAGFGIAAGTQEGCTGVWAGGAKVAAIGVRVSGGVSSHGFALNVDPDLGYYQHIVPCGAPGLALTSMARLLGAPPNPKAVREAVRVRFAERFGLALRSVDAAALAL